MKPQYTDSPGRWDMAARTSRTDAESAYAGYHMPKQRDYSAAWWICMILIFASTLVILIYESKGCAV